MDRRLLLVLATVAVIGSLLSAVVHIAKRQPMPYGVSKKDLSRVFEANEKMGTTRFKVEPHAPPAAQPALRYHAPLPELQIAQVKATVEDKKKEAKKKKLADAKKEKIRRKKRKKRLETLAVGQPARAPRVDVTIIGKDAHTEPSGGGLALPQGQPGVDPSAADAKQRRDQMLAQLEYNLINLPRMQDMARLIKLYQAGKITPPEYYGILKKMVQSPVEESHRLAVYGANVTPNEEGFSILADIATLDPDNDVKTQAQAALGYYEKLSSLTLLGNMMNSGDLSAKIQAIHTLDRLAIQMKSSSVTDGRTGSNRGDVSTQTTASGKSYFESFIPLLRGFLTGSETSNLLRSLSQQALQHIDQLG